MIFLLELKIFGESVQRTHENSKNDGFCEELLNKNDFEAVLSTLFCYDYGANVFGGSPEDRYRSKILSMANAPRALQFIISIRNSEKGLVTWTPPT